ncbi:hypothetical protein AaE_012419 [Aphanomyces astaci]|uniref:Uncharacterized protein n=1 Tax=Aphanomyces astaci TaxID=112090 RepID=A0A6A4ZI52_APHAT|nr:hypothetical protein AaE_012419 [Aphanomyces astaci]
MSGVLRLLLASLVYHYDFLVAHLQPNHPLLSTALFVEPGLAASLRLFVICGLESQCLVASGIPPHVELMRQLDKNQKSIQDISSIVLSGVREIVDEKGLAAGNVTREFFESTLTKAIADVVDVARAVSNPHRPHVDERAADYPVHHWGGQLHMLPKDFKFPSVDLGTAWSLWWRGNPSQKVPPFRKICTRDLSLKSECKEFYEWKYIMGKLSSYYTAQHGNGPNATASPEELIASFTIANRLLDPIRLTTTKKRTRRGGQLRVSTAARLVRQMEPPANQRPYQKRNKRPLRA